MILLFETEKINDDEEDEVLAGNDKGSYFGILKGLRLTEERARELYGAENTDEEGIDVNMVTFLLFLFFLLIAGKVFPPAKEVSGEVCNSRRE